jgi:hypothetical protein
MNAACLFQVPHEYAETWQLSSVLKNSKLLLLLFKYIYMSVSDVYDYTGKHVHFINSMTGLNRLQIIIVTITVILQLHLAHYLIGLCFLQGFLPDIRCVLATGIFEP